VQRLAGIVGFHVLPQRWKVERTLAWLSRNRRLSRDYERNPDVSEARIHVAMWFGSHRHGVLVSTCSSARGTNTQSIRPEGCVPRVLGCFRMLAGANRSVDTGNLRFHRSPGGRGECPHGLA
jgi:hypothetical protein